MRKQLLSGLILCLLVMCFSSCLTTFKSLVYNVPDITDHKRFLQLPVGASKAPFSLTHAKEDFTLPEPDKWALNDEGNLSKAAIKHTELDGFLKATETTAFIVLSKGDIIYERYFNGYDQNKPSQVFSLTKSVMSALVGIAIDEGKIKSINQPVSDFIPEFSSDSKPLTIENLLQMTSGFDYDDYKFWGHIGKITRMYYIKNQKDFLHRIDQKYEPGERWNYCSYATLVMGLCLEKAVGMRVNEYLLEKIWDPMGAEYPASWSAHKDSVAKMYGGLVTVARDLAKFGQLYANEGYYNGQQIVPEQWVRKAGFMDTTNGAWWGYSHCWWTETYSDEDHKETAFKDMGDLSNNIPPKSKSDYFSAGFKGQTIYVDPLNDLVVVRLGKKSSGVSWGFSLSYFAHHLEKGILNDRASN